MTNEDIIRVLRELLNKPYLSEEQREALELAILERELRDPPE